MNIRMPIELIDRMRIAADSANVSAGSIVRRALRHYWRLTERENRRVGLARYRQRTTRAESMPFTVRDLPENLLLDRNGTALDASRIVAIVAWYLATVRTNRPMPPFRTPLRRGIDYVTTKAELDAWAAHGGRR
jgi:hypothetical protein